MTELHREVNIKTATVTNGQRVLKVSLTEHRNVAVEEFYTSLNALGSLAFGLIASNWMESGKRPDALELKDIQKNSAVRHTDGALKHVGE